MDTNTLHTAQLKNHCPECYSKEGLELKFTQETMSSNWLTKKVGPLNINLSCHRCDTVLYPVSWDASIERAIEYQQKRVHPQKVGRHYTSWAYVLLLAGIIVIGALLYISLEL